MKRIVRLLLSSATCFAVSSAASAQQGPAQQYAELRIAHVIRAGGNQVYVSLDTDKGNEFTCHETAQKDANDDDESLYRACLTKLLQDVTGAKLATPTRKVLIFDPLFLSALSAAGWNLVESQDMNTGMSLGHVYYLRRAR
jgi:tRNA A37 threonylcarbamoyladenosine modification protein TsaB